MNKVCEFEILLRLYCSSILYQNLAHVVLFINTLFIIHSDIVLFISIVYGFSYESHVFPFHSYMIEEIDHRGVLNRYISVCFLITFVTLL